MTQILTSQDVDIRVAVDPWDNIHVTIQTGQAQTQLLLSAEEASNIGYAFEGAVADVKMAQKRRQAEAAASGIGDGQHDEW